MMGVLIRAVPRIQLPFWAARDPMIPAADNGVGTANANTSESQARCQRPQVSYFTMGKTSDHSGDKRKVA